MNARILALIGLLALGLPLLLWFLSRSDSAERGERLPENNVPAALSPEDTEPQSELEVPVALVEPQQEPAELRQERSADSEVQSRSWPEEETRWIEVHILFPPETPAEEQVRVLALAEGGAFLQTYGKDGPVALARAGKATSDLPGVLGSADVDVNGTARIGLPPTTNEVWLAVDGLYLYSLERRRIDLEGLAGPVTLRPALGARITGRLRTPMGSTKSDAAQVRIELDWSINASLQLGSAGGERLRMETESNAEGQFEFRSVPIGKPKTIRTTAPRLARVFSDDLEPAAGEHAHVELALLAGGSVRGRVVDEGNNPVEAAEVQAVGRELLGNPTDELRETHSDAEGRFELAGLTPGKAWIKVEHDDHQTLLSPPFQLADMEERDLGDIHLSEGQAISGAVRFPDGRAAPKAHVKVQPDLAENLSGSPVDPRAYIGARNDATTDEEGVFRIKGLGNGPWIVSADLEGEEDAPGGRWTAAQGLVRAPSSDLQLTLEPPVTVSGIVLDSAQQAVQAFSIHAERAGSQWYMPPSETKEKEFVSQDGRFSMADLRSGGWTFTARGEGYARSAEAKLELPTDQELTFELLRPIRLGGRVVDPEERPVAGAEVAKELEGTEVFEAMQGRGDWLSARSDDEGNFTLDGLPPGAGSIVAKKDGFAPSEPISLDLEEGQEQLDLVLTLRRGGTISGEVYDANGGRSSGCLVILQMPTLAERRMVNTDGDGAFEEKGLKPGAWQVQAFPGIENLQSKTGESLDQATLLAALKMTTVELVDEAVEHVVLGAPPADPVRVFGRVTLDGAPVSDSMISFVSAGGGGLELLKIKSLGADGSYEVQLDEPGAYLVTIQNSTTPGRQNSIESRHSIPKAEEYELDFELPLGGVSGRVLGPDGDPAPQARITLTPQGGLVFGTVFGGHYNETATDANGEYEIPFLRPGRYSVAAGGSLLATLFGDGSELGREVQWVDVRENQWVRGLDFQLEEPGSIQGTVRDSSGKLVAEASIFLRDEEGRLVELFSVFQTNASGRFEYPGLAPGNYTVSARSSNLASTNEVPVRVRSGESAETTVVLEPGTILLVTLVDESDTDIPSRVSVLDEQNHEMNGMLGLAQIMERYSGGLDNTVQSIGPLPPGTYEVRAITEDGRDTSRSVSLKGQAERKVKLRLK